MKNQPGSRYRLAVIVMIACMGMGVVSLPGDAFSQAKKGRAMSETNSPEMPMSESSEVPKAVFDPVGAWQVSQQHNAGACIYKGSGIVGRQAVDKSFPVQMTLSICGRTEQIVQDGNLTVQGQKITILFSNPRTDPPTAGPIRYIADRHYLTIASNDLLTGQNNDLANRGGGTSWTRVRRR